jgi:hypothetical protein
MMIDSFRKARCILAGVAVALFASYAPPAADAKSDESYKKSPGYVDLDPIVGDMESKIEVFLKGSLLVLAREAVREDDPELGDLLSKITYVHVKVLPADETNAPALEEKVRRVGKQLEKDGWEMTVRVREDDENVLIYLLPGAGDQIHGVVVMVVDEGEEAAFINIVGDINPAEIGRLGRALHVDSMDILKVEVDGDAEIVVDESVKKRKSND